MIDTSKTLATYFSSNKLFCKKALTIFSLISNKARFKIILLLNKGDFCVKEIVEIINAGEVSYISQQLKALTLAGILTKKKDKRNVIYSLQDDKIITLVQFFQEQYMDKKP